LKLQQASGPPPDLTALLKNLEQPKSSYLAWVHTGAGNMTRVLSVDEILYFQAGDKYTEVVTATQRHVIRTSLKELRQRLNPDQFVQIHRSTIVNLRAVERVERDVLGRSLVHLKGHSDVIQVGRAYVNQFKRM
jgi:DNA-binding LytR/AlgR family response regulator